MGANLCYIYIASCNTRCETEFRANLASDRKSDSMTSAWMRIRSALIQLATRRLTLWFSLRYQRSRTSIPKDPTMDERLQHAADLLRRSTRTIALTGAGISTPSGIPDFRSPTSGLWATFDPLEVASVWNFHAAPERFYAWMRPLAAQILGARPNPAHTALARLEAGNLVHGIITQNIDSLHQAAGSKRVHEVHGHLRSASCLDCHFQRAAGDLWDAFLQRGELPRCDNCGAVLKPDAILFGEPLSYNTLRLAQEDALHCDVFIVVGSSLEVEPAADLPFLAQRRGAQVIVFNYQPTPIDARAALVLSADAAVILPRLADILLGPAT